MGGPYKTYCVYSTNLGSKWIIDIDGSDNFPKIWYQVALNVHAILSLIKHKYNIILNRS